VEVAAPRLDPTGTRPLDLGSVDRDAAAARKILGVAARTTRSGATA